NYLTISKEISFDTTKSIIIELYCEDINSENKTDSKDKTDNNFINEDNK
ncbi:11495_t:CDS:1, partial [Funneliformis caledonium]